MPIRYPHLFTKGSSVEVLSEEQDYGCVFFAATVIEPSPSPRSGAKKKLHVRYRNLLAEEGGSEPLEEHVDVSFVRPEPPPPPPQERVEGFEVGETVDAFCNGGWWTGVVTQLVEGGDNSSRRRFVVNFHHPPDLRDFGESDLRPHLDWVDGAWVKPEKQVIPVHLSDNGAHFLNQALQKSPHKVQSLMNNQPDKLTPRKRSQVTTRSPTPQSRVSSPPLRKQKLGTMEVLSDLKSEDPTSDNSSRRNPIRKYQRRAGAKQVDGKMSSLSATSMNKSSEKLLQPQTTEAAIGGPGKKCPSQDVRNKRARNDDELQLIICLPFSPDKGASASGKSRAKKDQKSSGAKRGRPRKKSSSGLQSPTGGNDKNEITNPILLDKGQDNLEASGEQTKETKSNAATEEIITQEVPYSNSTDNSSLAIIQPPPAVVVKSKTQTSPENTKLVSIVMPKNSTDGEAPQERTAYDPENNHLPFVKTHSLWEPIDSMEVFKRTPQRPHFTPLKKFPEYSREGLAIGSMLTYARVAEKASNLRFTDPTSTIVEIFGTLAELESQGFDIRAARDRVRSVLAMKDKHRGCVEEVKKIEKDIVVRRDDKRRICQEIDLVKGHLQKLQGMLKDAEEAREKADEDIACLESKLREAVSIAEACFSS